MAKKIKVWLNNELNKCLHCTDVITFYHIFVTELVFTFFVFKYQNHFEFPRLVSEVPVQKFWKGKGKGGAGSSKTPWNGKSWEVGGGANQRVFAKMPHPSPHKFGLSRHIWAV